VYTLSLDDVHVSSARMDLPYRNCTPWYRSSMDWYSDGSVVTLVSVAAYRHYVIFTRGCCGTVVTKNKTGDETKNSKWVVEDRECLSDGAGRRSVDADVQPSLIASTHRPIGQLSQYRIDVRLNMMLIQIAASCHL